MGGTAVDNRLFVDPVLHRFRAGIAWPGALWTMPERVGKGKSVHHHFARWAKVVTPHVQDVTFPVVGFARYLAGYRRYDTDQRSQKYLFP